MVDTRETPLRADASAQIAYLNGETGASVVAGLLSDPDVDCFAHAVNSCEVYYGAVRVAGEQAGSTALSVLESDGLVERQDMDRPFWKQVGRLKADGGICIPDCFCI